MYFDGNTATIPDEVGAGELLNLSRAVEDEDTGTNIADVLKSIRGHSAMQTVFEPTRHS